MKFLSYCSVGCISNQHPARGHLTQITFCYLSEMALALFRFCFIIMTRLYIQQNVVYTVYVVYVYVYTVYVVLCIMLYMLYICYIYRLAVYIKNNIQLHICINLVSILRENVPKKIFWKYFYLIETV